MCFLSEELRTVAQVTLQRGRLFRMNSSVSFQEEGSPGAALPKATFGHSRPLERRADEPVAESGPAMQVKR